MDEPSIVLASAMDRKVFGWLGENLGRVLSLTPHARWRTGWDAEVERGGETVALYIRGPRGDNYISPIDMRQEAAIHRALLAGGIPAPASVRVRGVISGVGDGVFRGGACPTPECGVAGGHRAHRYGGVCRLQP